MCKTLRVLLFVSTFAVACVGQTEAPAESWSDRVEVEVKSVQDEGGPVFVEVAIEAKKGWSINTAYPGLKVEFSEKTPVKLRLMKKTAAHFEHKKPENKAARAVFRTELDAKAPVQVEGKYKVVICNEATCSPPFTGSFNAKISAAKTAPTAG